MTLIKRGVVVAGLAAAGFYGYPYMTPFFVENVGR